MTGDVPETKPKRLESLRSATTWVLIIIAAGLLALFISSFIFRSYAISGPSMEITMHDQDKVLVWKAARSLAKITGNQYVPGRGDIVIVDLQDASACGGVGKEQIIKRVIGLPGERVVVADGKLTVFNTQNPNGFSPDATLPYNQDGRIPVTPEDTDVTLRGDQLFIAGDNRGNSCDSRTFGPINTQQVIGKLVLRVMPLNDITVF